MPAKTGLLTEEFLQLGGTEWWNSLDLSAG